MIIGGFINDLPTYQQWCRILFSLYENVHSGIGLYQGEKFFVYILILMLFTKLVKQRKITEKTTIFWLT